MDVDQFIPLTPHVANEFKKNPRTIKRWAADPELGFPQTIKINQRLFVRRSDLDAWKAQRLEMSISGRA